MKVRTVLGLALIAANLYANAHETASGRGTPDDPFVIRTHSPLLAMIGVGLLFLEVLD